MSSISDPSRRAEPANPDLAAILARLGEQPRTAEPTRPPPGFSVSAASSARPGPPAMEPRE